MIPFSYLAFVQVSSTGVIADEWVFADPAPGGAAQYTLVSYAPAVAAHRRSRLGGAGDYDETTDTLTVHVLGGTAAQCVANYDRLMLALDTAARWSAEQGAEVIQVRAQILGGTVGELAAVVLGPAPGEAPATPAPQFDETIGVWAIRGVALRFRRRGLWLEPATENATGTTATTGEIMTATLADHDVLSPIYVAAEGVNAASNPQGYLLTAGEAAQFQIYNARDWGAVAGGANVVDVATNYSRSGTILRFTAASAATAMRADYAAVSLPARCQVAHVFCNARPGSAAAQWALRVDHADAGASIGTGPTSIGTVRPVPQAAAVGLVYLGTIARVERWSVIRITAFVTAAAFPQTLDLDTIVLLAEDDTTGILYADGPLLVYDNNTSLASIDPRPLADVAPRVTARAQVADTFAATINYAGDAYLQQRGAALAALWYLTLAPATSVWRPTTTGPAGPATARVRVRRWKGYRVPQ